MPTGLLYLLASFVQLIRDRFDYFLLIVYSEGSDIDLAAVGENITFNQLMDINIQIEDLGLLYKVDVVDYNKNVGTPIGEHIDRVGLLFYEKQ